MAFFCAMTPWVYDDFNYGAGDGGPGTMFAAQVQEYRSWSGKFAGHFMARVLLHGPAWLHPLLTSVIFTDLVFSRVLLSLGVGWREKIRQTRETVEKRGHAFSGFIPVFAAGGIDRFSVCPHVVVAAIQECMNYSDIV